MKSIKKILIPVIIGVVILTSAIIASVVGIKVKQNKEDNAVQDQVEIEDTQTSGAAANTISWGSNQGTVTFTTGTNYTSTTSYYITFTLRQSVGTVATYNRRMTGGGTSYTWNFLSYLDSSHLNLAYRSVYVQVQMRRSSYTGTVLSSVKTASKNIISIKADPNGGRWDTTSAIGDWSSTSSSTGSRTRYLLEGQILTSSCFITSATYLSRRGYTLRSSGGCFWYADRNASMIATSLFPSDGTTYYAGWQVNSEVFNEGYFLTGEFFGTNSGYGSTKSVIYGTDLGSTGSMYFSGTIPDGIAANFSVYCSYNDGDYEQTYSINNYSTATGQMDFDNFMSSKNAGTYKFYVYAFLYGTNCYNGPYAYVSTKTSSTYTLTITKANISPSVSMSGYTYGGTKSSPSISGNSGGGSVTYYYNTSNSNSNGTAWSNVSSSTSLNAGTYYMYAVVAATTNYNGATTATKSFTISKASISPSVSMSGYTYGGTKSSPSISGNTGGGSVTYYYNTSNSNSGGTAWSNVSSSTSLNAGTYYMYAVVGSTTNYNGATTATKSFTIARATGSVSISPASRTVTYGTSSTTFTVSGTGTLSASDNNGTVSVSVSGSTLTVSNLASINAGTTITVTVTAAQSTNYNSASKTCTVTITKANISPTVNMSGYTYGGTKSSPSVSGNSGGGSVTYYYNTSNSNSGGTAWSSVSSSTSLNAGTYYMYAVVGSTTNYNGATTATKSFTIARATGSVSISPASRTVTYGTSSTTFTISGTGTLSASDNNGTATVSVSGSTLTVSNLASINAGTTITVTVTAAQSTNYNSASKTCTVTISRATGSVSISPASRTVTYGTSSTTFTVSGTGTLSASDNNSTATVSISGSTLTVSNLSSISAGTTITITVTAAQSTNYNSASKTCTVTISRTTGSVSISPASRSLAYGTSSTTFTVSGTGTLSASDNNSTATVSISGSTLTVSNLASIGAGTTITVTVTAAQSTNYNSASKTCTVTISTCVLTANANGGSISSTSGWSGTGNTATKTLNYGASYSTLPSVSRTGYTLKGWYTASSGGTQVTSSTTMGRTNTTIYAQWTINTYTVKVTRNSNNVTHPTSINISASGCTISDSSIAAGESATISHTYSTSPITISFEFTRSNTSYNYYADINVNGSWNSSMKNSGSYSWTPTSNITIHLGILELFTVKSQAGTGVSSATFYYIWGDPIGPVTTREVYYGGGIDFSATVKTGYTFKGWYTNSAGTGTAVSTSADFSIEKQNPGITDSATYYAIATPNTYTITYNGNGHTGGSTSNSTHTYDVSKALNTNGYTKQGYSFMGWATSASGSKVYNDGQAVLNLTSTNGATVTLYAVWAVGQSPYTVNLYVMNTSGSYALNSTVTRNGTTNSTITLSTLAEDAGSNIIVPNGIEYSYGTVGGSTVTSTTVLADGSRTINLYFERLKHTLTRDLDGGYVSTNNSRNYTVDVYYQRTLSFGATDLKVGYSLVGYTLSGGGGATVTSLASNGNATFTMGTEDVTLTSQWEANTYNLYYDYNDGSNPNLYGYHLVVDSEMTYSNGEFTTASASSLVSGNAYSFSKVQLYNGSSYVSELSIKDSTGTFVTTFTKTEDVNRIKIAANGNLADNGIYISIDNLINNETYTIQCLITSYSSSTIKFKNIKIEQGSTATAYTQEAKAVTYDSNYGTLPTPTRTGYTFNGWVNNYFDLESFVNFYNDNNSVNTGYTPYLMPDGHTIRWCGPSGHDGKDIIYKPGVTVDGKTYGTALANGTYRLSYYGDCPTINEGQSTTNLCVVNADGGVIVNPGYVPCDGVRHFYSFTFNVDDNFGGFRLSYNYSYLTYFDNIILERIDDHTPTYTTSSSTVKTPIDHTLTASWDINSYTLTANANGGSISSTSGWSGTGNTATKSVTYQASYGTLPTVTREGYTFKGWYTASSGGTQVTSSTTMGAGNTTIYAQWDINSYTLTANANGGSISSTSGWSGTGNTATKTLNYGASYGTLPSVSRTGYTLKGWYTASSGGTQVTSSTTMGIGNTTIYAQWTINSYTLTANANGGTISSTSGWSGTGNTATKTLNYGASYGTLPSVSRTGYTLKGWYTASSGGTQVTSSTIMGIGNTTIYAQWTINTYTVTVTRGGNITHPTSINISASGCTISDSSIAAGESATISHTYSTSPITISFEFTRSDSSYNYHASINVNGAWNSGITNSGSYSWTPTGNITLDLYIYEMFLVKVEAGTGVSNAEFDYIWRDSINNSSLTSYNVLYGAGIDFRATIQEGYTFKGWYTNSEGTGTPVSTSANFSIEENNPGITDSATYYAIAEPVGLQVVLNKQGGGNNETIDVTYTQALPNVTPPVRDGYTFGGYFTQPLGQGEQYYNSNGQGIKNWDKTSGAVLYAKWTAVMNIVYVGEQDNIRDATDINLSVTSGSFSANSLSLGETARYSIVAGASVDSITITATRAGSGNYYINFGSNCSTSSSLNTATYSVVPSNRTINIYLAQRMFLRVTHTTNYDECVHSTNLEFSSSGAKLNIIQPVLERGEQNYIYAIYNSGNVILTASATNSQYDYYIETLYDGDYEANPISWDTTFDAYVYYSVIERFTVDIGSTTGISSAQFSVDWRGNITTYSSAQSVLQGSGITFTAQLEQGYSFKGWYDNPEGTGNPLSTSLEYEYCVYANPGGGGVRSNVTLYAVANISTYTVTVTIKDNNVTHPTSINISASGCTISDSSIAAGESSTISHTYSTSPITISFEFTKSDSSYNYNAGVYVNSSWNSSFTNSGNYSWTPTGNIDINLYIYEMFLVKVEAGTGVSNAEFDYIWNNTEGPLTEYNYVVYGAGIDFRATVEEGYTFKGWYTNSEGIGTAVSTSANFSIEEKNPGITDSATYYAIATPNSYTLTANANGGSISSTSGWSGTGNSATKSVTYQTSYGTLPSVSRTGYTFKGWYTQSSGGTQVTSSTIMGIGNTTIYAQWTINIYTVTVTRSGNITHPTSVNITASGCTITDSSIAAGESSTISHTYSTSPITISFEFTRSNTSYNYYASINMNGSWYGSMTNSGSYNWTPTGNIDINLYIYEQFLIEVEAGTGISNAEFDYILNSNFESSLTSKNALYGAGIDFRATVEEGYTFKGWYTNSEGTGNPVSTSANFSIEENNPGITDSATYYAIASVDNYSVTLDYNGGTDNLFNNNNNLLDGTFENGETGSPTIQSEGIADISNNSFNGNNSLRFNSTVPGTYGSRLVYWISSLQNGDYRLRARVMASEDTELILTVERNDTYAQLIQTYIDLQANTWVQIDGTFNINFDASMALIFRIVDLNVDLYIDDIEITNISSNYSPKTSYEYNINTGEVKLPYAVKSGYVFKGWNTKADGTGDYVTSYNGALQANVTYYAIYELSAATVVISGDKSSIKYGSEGATISASVDTNGLSSSLTYQWYRGTSEDFEMNSTSLISGANSSTYNHTASLTDAGTYYYKVLVTNSKDGETAKAIASNTIQLVVNPGDANLEISMQGYTYNETVASPQVENNISGGEVTFYYNTSESSTGGTLWNNVTPTSLNAGTYYMYATVSANGNYLAGVSNIVEFVVAKGDLNSTITTNNNNLFSKVYDGTELSAYITAPFTYTVYFGPTIDYGAVIENSANSLTKIAGRTTIGSETYYYRITAPNFEDEVGNITLTINPREVAVVWEIETYTYNGTDQGESVKAYYEDASGTKVYCDVSFNGEDTVFMNAGSYIATASDESGVYILTNTTIEVEMNKASVTITADNKTITYGDNAPTFTHSVSGNIASKDSYTVSYSVVDIDNSPVIVSNTTDAGQYIIKPSSNLSTDNYNISYENGSLIINKYNLSNATIDDIEDYTYTGYDITPKPSVTALGVVLTENVHYMYSYDENVKVGEATVTATAVEDSNFTGSISTTFNITSVVVQIPTSQSELVYTAQEQTANIPTSSQYTLTNNTATDAGNYNATASLVDKENYTWSDGSATDKLIPFTIKKADTEITLEKQTVELRTGTTTTNKASVIGVGSFETGAGITVTGLEEYANISAGDLINKESIITIEALKSINSPQTVTVTFSGDKNHNGSIATFTIEIPSIIVQVITSNGNVTINNTISGTDNEVLLNSNITFTATPNTGYGLIYYIVGDSTTYINSSDLGANYTSPAITVTEDKIENDVLTITVMFDQIVNIDINITGDEGSLGDGITFTANVNSNAVAHNYSNGQLTAFATSTITYSIEAGTIENQYYAIKSVKVNGETISTNVTTASGTYLASELESIDIQTSKIYEATDKNIVDDSKTVATVEIEVFDNNELLIINEEKYILEDAQVNYKVTKSDSNYDFLGIMVNGELRLYNQEDASTWDYDENTNTYTWKNQVYSENVSNAEPVVLERWFTPGVTTDKTINVQVDSGINAELANTVIGYKYALATGIFTSGTASLYAGTWQVNLINSNASVTISVTRNGSVENYSVGDEFIIDSNTTNVTIIITE